MACAVKYTKVNVEEATEDTCSSSLKEEDTYIEDEETVRNRDTIELIHIPKDEQSTPEGKSFWRSRACPCNGKYRCSVYSWKFVIAGILVFTISVTISLIIALLLKEPSQKVQIGHGGVATDVPICSEMSRHILENGGSSVDAAITAMLCVGVVNAESSGIGGGGFMLVYDSSNQTTHTIDFREVAPLKSSINMFNGSSYLSKIGGLSVAIPGELAGMKMAHDMFGRLPWKQLFEPVINLARDGFEMTSHSAIAVRKVELYLSTNKLFREWYYNNDSLKTSGDIIKRAELGDALERIADNGINEFYNGSISNEIINEIQQNGGILTREDLLSYKPLLLESVKINFSDIEVHTPPLPSGGPELLFILNVMEKFGLDKKLRENNLTYQHLIESFKYAFAIRSELGDPWCSSCDKDNLLSLQHKIISNEYAIFINQSISDNTTYDINHYNASCVVNDAGTSHISIIAPDGMAVSVTTSVNTYFGAQLITSSGIVLNNEMDDFSSPNVTNAYGLHPYKANYIFPGKRPLSSTCPTIALKHEDGLLYPKLVTGGSGGTHILTANAQVILNVLLFGEDIKEAIESRRLHHQLIPNIIYQEDGYPTTIISYLESLGHNVTMETSFAAIQGVLSANETVTAHSDTRKNGRAYTFKSENK